MVESIARGTQHDYEMIDLVQLHIRPCTGCVKCAKTNRCRQEDDMTPLYDKIVESRALILGGVTYFAHPNGFTRAFMERLFPLRHVKPVTMSKPAVAVAVGGDEAEQTVREIAYHLDGYFNFNVVGSVYFNSATPPCFICGFGTTCEYGGPARWMTPEEFEAFDKVTPDMFKKFEDDSTAVSACVQAAVALKKALDNA
jgi:multimeric flavodoxin WrbA